MSEGATSNSGQTFHECNGGRQEHEAAAANGEAPGPTKDPAEVKKIIDQLVAALGPQRADMLCKLLPSSPPPPKAQPGEGALWNALSWTRAAEKKTAAAKMPTLPKANHAAFQ